MAASVPCPSASGAMPKTSSAPSSAPKPATSGSGQGRANEADPHGPALARGGRHAVAGKHARKKWVQSNEGLVEDDRAAPGDGPDDDAEDDPLLEIGGRGDPAAGTSGDSPCPHRAARTGIFAHRSHPVLQSCSGTSPALAVSCRRAATTERWVSGGTDFQKVGDLLPATFGHRIDQLSAGLGQREAHRAAVMAVGAAPHQALAHQALA